MENIIKYGLLGRDISYSFSQTYFTEKFKSFGLKNYYYDVFDIPNLEILPQILSDLEVKGFNVTIPYKEKIIPFLDDLSDEAKNIGAVNTVKIVDDKMIGYNTDIFGFEKSLCLYKKDFHQKAMVLGDGGAAKAVKFVLEKYNIPFVTVSRKSEDLNFNNLLERMVFDYQIIVQCTPVGTYPNVKECLPFPFEGLTNKHLIIDLIYNPQFTQFMKNATKQGAKCMNGYYMLQQQAEKAWEIWQY